MIKIQIIRLIKLRKSYYHIIIFDLFENLFKLIKINILFFNNFVCI